MAETFRTIISQNGRIMCFRWQKDSFYLLWVKTEFNPIIFKLGRIEKIAKLANIFGHYRRQYQAAACLYYEADFRFSTRQMASHLQS
ncbi:CLUMA_CG009601, isoform A [Clunio marinus]|uniref:CLUMA_CG009601, isoform A n=1 Tax=Clunio marinus TaxID=568069 RepID=A0A1J1I9C5_9DIPT|nr:CLUMA_CG009601, isoform A [Clunio marinus]